MTPATALAQPCNPDTLLGVCAGNCGRRLHRHRTGTPYSACVNGHPVNDGRNMCAGCRRSARLAGMIATYPRTRDRDDPPTFTATGGQLWRAQAACRDEDPELFFPVHGGGPNRDRQVAQAKTVCRRCPVVADCLTEALARIPYGVAGGLDETERRQLIVARAMNR